MIDLATNGVQSYFLSSSQEPISLSSLIVSIVQFKNSLLWILDEEIPNSFGLKSNDEALDMKLLQMYRLYDKTLSAVLFAQIDVEK